MNVYKNNKLIIQGNRNKTDGLWDIPIQENYKLPKPLGAYKTITPATHKIPTFLQHINIISKQPTKLACNSTSVKIPTFIQNMNQLAEDNKFDQILQEHNKLNVIIRKRQTKQQLATYLHATCLSPTPRTFMQAIKQNNFITWLGLTPELISKHLQKSIATIRGHQESERQELQLTSSTIIPPDTEEDIQQDYFPPSD